jgi:hypothetical protein
MLDLPGYHKNHISHMVVWALCRLAWRCCRFLIFRHKKCMHGAVSILSITW